VHDFELKYFAGTYGNYTKASLRKVDPLMDKVHAPYDPNSYNSILGLIPGVVRLLTVLVAPFLFLLSTLTLAVYYALYHTTLTLDQFMDSSFLIVMLLLSIIYGSTMLIYFYYPSQSPIRDGRRGENPFGASLRPGLYFSDKSDTIKDVLKGCPLLMSDEVTRSALPTLDAKGFKTGVIEATPWMFTGDMRTIFPFLAFSPKKVNYIRRWVRVPLQDGPLCDLIHEDKTSKYEAVAVDWLPPSKSSSSSKDKGPAMAVILLAGLTGGSEEGYILDLVNTVHARGWHAFVMLGRGLGGTPCASDAFFHGARTCDLKATATVVRACLPVDHKICVAGISMGGIICVNAFAKGDMAGLADCGLSIGGTFDTHRNRYFIHSRDVWQPVLSQGLKEAFAAQPGCMRRMVKRLGPRASDELDAVQNVSDFDHKVIKPLNRFHNQEHYYKDMSPRLQEYKNLKKPFLTLHAAEDPILHVDSIPVEMAQAGKVTTNFIALITDTGGHVGWPLGWTPWKHRWLFQNTLLMEFCESVLVNGEVTDVSKDAAASGT
jgi:predicted alpha/beta-fold hydrolase